MLNFFLAIKKQCDDPYQQYASSINIRIQNILMISKIFKPQNPNKKKLQILKDTKESLQQPTQSTLIKTCSHHQKHQQHQSCLKMKNSDSNILPRIDTLSKSRVSISLPPEGSTIKGKYPLTSSSKLYPGPKVKPSPFFKIRNYKIQDVVNIFIQDFVNRNVFHFHFGKYLIQPKVLFQILLFVLNSFNNSKSFNIFIKIISDFNNYEELIRELQNDQFSFKFAIRNNKKLSYSHQNINLNIENQYRINQEKQGQTLAYKNQQLLKEIVEKYAEKSQLEKCINEYQTKIDSLNSEIKRLNTQIIKENDIITNLRGIILENQKICERLEASKRQYSTLMINFNENKYNQVAVNTRRLQEDLFDYVQYLNFHPLGKRAYQKSKYACDIEKMMINQLQEFCKYITAQAAPLQNKIKLMKDFIQKTKEEYKIIINQLLIVIQEKTDFIDKYTNIISKWHENYRTKKNMMAELNKFLSFQVLNLEQIKIPRQSCGDNHRFAKHRNTQNQAKIINIAQKIITIYQIASSFI